MNNNFEGSNDTGAHTTPTPSPNPFESDPAKARQDHNLSREAAKWRTQYRSAEARIAELEQQLAGAPVASQPAGAAPSSVPVSADEGDADLRQLRDELQGAALLRSLTEGGALLPEEAADILRARGQIVFDSETGLPALLIDGQPQPITFQTLSKLLHPMLLGAAGVAGSGSRMGQRGAVGSIDYERAMRDHAYFRQHQAEVRAEFKRRNNG